MGYLMISVSEIKIYLGFKMRENLLIYNWKKNYNIISIECLVANGRHMMWKKKHWHSILLMVKDTGDKQ